MTTHLRALTRSSLTFCLLFVAVIAVNLLLSVTAAAHTPSSLFKPSTAYTAQSRSSADFPSSIVFVHGSNTHHLQRDGGWPSSGWDCQKEVWGVAKSYIRKMTGIGDFRTIKYYQGDVNCDADLHAKAYQDHCLHYQSGDEGTDNESLYHLSCLFAWYLYYNFGQKGSSEIVIAHSMGGLILREAIYQVQNRDVHFPTSLGHITEAITLNTPHLGLNDVASLLCALCSQQLKDMSRGSTFMNDLLTKGQDPQAGGTDWTLIGSACDPLAGVDAVHMDGANHAVLYVNGLGPGTSPPYLGPGTNPVTTCYDHGGALGDQDSNFNTLALYCDTQNVALRRCYITNTQWSSAAPHSLQAIVQVITSHGYSPVVGEPERRGPR